MINIELRLIMFFCAFEALHGSHGDVMCHEAQIQFLRRCPCSPRLDAGIPGASRGVSLCSTKVSLPDSGRTNVNYQPESESPWKAAAMARRRYQKGSVIPVANRGSFVGRKT